jgi:DNA gyrase/topoisomerase IV subunit B
VSTQDTTLLSELAATAVRALLLYCLAEHQSGNASTIRVVAEGSSFGISDNGRGHPLDKSVEGTSYLKFIYTHFDYPFESGLDAPIQLHGIGMSLVNALCSELQVIVRKPDVELRLLFNDGHLVHSARTAAVSAETGITVTGKIAPHLCSRQVEQRSIEEWLLNVLRTVPALRLFFNGRQLQLPPRRAG